MPTTAEQARLKVQIREISEQLRVLHIREGVLKARLNEVVQAQFDSTQSELRGHRSPSNHPTPNNSKNHKKVITDKFGVELEVGDEIEFLTTGKNTSDKGRVLSIKKTYVNCIDNDNVATRRAPHNLKVIVKYHEC